MRWCVLCGFVFVAGLTASEITLSERYPLFESNRVVSQYTDDRIVGGEEANIEDFPYQASFIVNNSYFCGAWFISENYLITAAHCAQSVDPSTVVLRAGSSFRKNGTVIPVTEVVPHPEYDQPPFDKDVAYIKTAEPVTFSDTIQPVALPPLNRALRGNIQVAGWGRLQQGANQIPNRLMNVTLPVVNYWQCLFAYPTVLTRNMVCAGNFFLGGKGTCQGDSGGVAVQDGVAVGIVSFGRGCASPFSASVFANVAAPTIHNFITNNTGVLPPST